MDFQRRIYKRTSDVRNGVDLYTVVLPAAHSRSQIVPIRSRFSVNYDDYNTALNFRTKNRLFPGTYVYDPSPL